jgi:hypothetical protein
MISTMFNLIANENSVSFAMSGSVNAARRAVAASLPPSSIRAEFEVGLPMPQAATSVRSQMPVRAAHAPPSRFPWKYCVFFTILLVLFSIVPVSAYFGIFRGSRPTSTVATAQQQQQQRQQVEQSKLKQPPAHNAINDKPAAVVNFGSSQLRDEDDQKTRAKLWLRYVGRAQGVPDEVQFKPTTMPAPLTNLLTVRERYEKADGGIGGRISCFTVLKT